MKRKTSFYRFMACACAVAMWGNMQVKAQDEAPFAGGSGTASDPYLIETVQQFDEIRNYRDKFFRLTADLDFSGVEFPERSGSTQWWPLGEWGSGDGAPERFGGTFNGDGHAIRNLSVTRDGAHDLSIFGVTNGATIKNLVVENCMIDGGGRLGIVTGQTVNTTIEQVAVINSYCNNTGTGVDAGGITGPFTQGSVISNCYVIGGGVRGTDRIGGICSRIEAGTVVEYCYSATTLEGGNVGGIAGTTEGGGAIMNCLAASMIASAGGDGRVVNPLGTKENLINNYADEDVRINDYESTDDLGGGERNGETATNEQLGTVDFWADNLGFAIRPEGDDEDYVQVWSFNPEGYPVFLWQASPSSVTGIGMNAEHTLYVNRGELYIAGLEAQDKVNIYTVDGSLLQSIVAGGNETVVRLGANGLLIVNVNGKFNYKVMND